MDSNDELRRIVESEVEIATGGVRLAGTLNIPENAGGVVVFAHGSGSSRHSPRNRFVARVLQEAHLGTLLMDLLTPAEEAAERESGFLRFNIGLLAERLVGALEWLKAHPQRANLKLGCFGASTGAAAALEAAGQRPELVAAVVSRGGRPDLTRAEILRQVQAPTLLIVGGNDFPVIEMNRAALAQLRCEKRLVIVPGASHLFEEPGALEEVARLARDWFERYLMKRGEIRAA
jgi:putative phosphoribosyl transferase